jgi:hypothetical protein
MFTNSPVFLIVLSSIVFELLSMPIASLQFASELSHVCNEPHQMINERTQLVSERLYFVNESICIAIVSGEADNVSLEVISEQL